MSGNWTDAMLFNQTTVESTTFTHAWFEMNANDLKLITLFSVYNKSWITETDNATILTATGIVLSLYTSELERVMFLLYIWMNGLVSLSLNAIVLLIIGKEPRLHIPENFIIALDAINNVAMVLSTNSFMVAVLHTNDVAPNYYACQVSGFVSAMSFVYTTYLMFVYSFERYSFLCNPITYGKRVTKPRLAAAVIIMLIPTIGFAFFTTFPNYTRVFSATGLLCVSRGAVRPIIVGLCIAVLPTLVMVVYAVINIKRLQSR